MKALHYLAKHGVTPKGDRQALVSTILYMSPLGNKDLVIYPDASWLDDADRRHRMLHWLNGTVEDIYQELKAMPIRELVEMLEDAIDQCVWDYGIENKVPNLTGKMADGREWARLWNRFLCIPEGSKGEWSNKAEVIEAYSTENRWEEEASSIIRVCEEVT